jgi:phage tail sheath protein FI
MASGAPGVHVDEVESAPAIAGVPTSVAAFVGWAAAGPADAPGLVASFAEFEQLYGGLSPGSLMSYAVMQFFENGGGQAYIVRLTPGPSGEGPPGGTAFHEALNADGSRLGANGAPVGVRLLDLVARFDLLCVPGESDPVTIGDLQAYVRAKRAFLIVDCQRADDVATLTAPAFRSSALFGGDAINSAFYFPWVEAPDPLNANQPSAYPPSGFVAGIYAATDAARGVWKAPAGPETGLAGASGLAVALTTADNAALNAAAVNCLRTLPQVGAVVWGARTLAGSDSAASDWKYVPVRRLALFIEASLYQGLQWVVFESNGPPLWARIRASVGAFMQSLFGRGAFQGAAPDQAYFVKCGADTMTQSDIDNGRLIIEVGFAPLEPAEFIVIQIQEMVGPGPAARDARGTQADHH